ncbi:MAG: outer membrane protein assembly factor [Bacteroidota bacterium]|nr:outer membrane protein assembly factor [Bacteroidota bacterium]
MGKFLILLLTCSFCLSCMQVTAQIESNAGDSLERARQEEVPYHRRQVDLIDLGMKLLGKNPSLRLKDLGKIDTKLKLSVGPIIEYTLSTGFTGGISAGAALSTSVLTPTNVSSILFAAKYTEKRQFLLPIQTSLWLPGNKFLFTGDWRFFKYPQNSYGFGGYTTANDVFTVSYQYIRFYETALKKIKGNLYAGLGYQLDYHTNISQQGVEPGRITDFSKYGFTNKSTSSGLSINLVYDSRKNSINPEGGSFFTSLMFLHNSTLLGSSSNSNSALIDIRKYFKLRGSLVLALWSYNVITLSGNPPYLDLPGTGSDTYNNTGRGYELGRFIGKKMVDLEAELRFGITKNGLLGGVIFTNAESVSELNNRFAVISPAAGIGLRVKFNKLSNTNACLDYGVGKRGSRGFFGNLGETF